MNGHTPVAPLPLVGAHDRHHHDTSFSASSIGGLATSPESVTSHAATFGNPVGPHPRHHRASPTEFGVKRHLAPTPSSSYAGGVSSSASNTTRTKSSSEAYETGSEARSRGGSGSAGSRLLRVPEGDPRKSRALGTKSEGASQVVSSDDGHASLGKRGRDGSVRRSQSYQAFGKKDWEYQVAEQLFLAGLFNNRATDSDRSPNQSASSAASNSPRRYLQASGDSMRSSLSSLRHKMALNVSQGSGGPKSSVDSSFSSRRTFSSSAPEPSDDRNETEKALKETTTTTEDFELESFPSPPYASQPFVSVSPERDKRGSARPSLPRLAEDTPSDDSDLEIEEEDHSGGWLHVPVESTEGMLQRVRPSTEAPVVYVSHHTGDFRDRSSRYMSTSPPLSPDRVTLLGPDDEATKSRRHLYPDDAGDMESFFTPLDYAGEADVMIPLPTEPVKSSLAYSPRSDRNFLSAPPRKLRKLWRRERRAESRERRALMRMSMSPQPSSVIPTLESSPAVTPRTTLEIRPEARPFLYTHSPLREDWSPSPENTDLLGVATGSGGGGPQGRSVWSLSNPPTATGAAGIRAGAFSDAISSNSASTRTFIVPLPAFLVPLTLIPSNAWCFVFGFVFPPLWWVGALYPITAVRPRRRRNLTRFHHRLGGGGPFSPFRRRGNDYDDDDVEGQDVDAAEKVDELGRRGRWLGISSSSSTSSTVAWAVAAGLVPAASTSAPDRLPGPRALSDWIIAGSSARPRKKDGSTVEQPFWASQRGAFFPRHTYLSFLR
jgi:hypothetical protein